MKRLFLIFFILLIPFLLVFSQSKIEPVGEPEVIFKKDHMFLRPSWSPAGDKIAFTGPKHKGIWVLDLTSKEIEQLTDSEGSGYQFAWSPDGDYIAYRARHVENYRSKMSIEAINIKTKNLEILTPQNKKVGLPQWGRNNNILFYTQNEKLQKINTGFKAASLSKTIFSKEDVLFTSYGKIQIAKIDKPDSLLNPFSKIEVINPVASPSERYIACEEYGGNLLILDLEKKKKIDLGKGHRPCWSPDGNWISFMVSEDDGHNYLSSDIYVSSIDGKKQFKLTNSEELMEMNPDWSPNGKAIVYDEYKSGTIYIQNILIE
jgi:Tol biopolymer transport system component